MLLLALIRLKGRDVSDCDSVVRGLVNTISTCPLHDQLVVIVGNPGGEGVCSHINIFQVGIQQTVDCMISLGSRIALEFLAQGIGGSYCGIPRFPLGTAAMAALEQEPRSN